MIYLYLYTGLSIIIGYFLGNINFALIISKFKKRDIRKESSGNPGAMNMIRTFGKKMGALTLILDGLKGIIAALAGWFLFGQGEFLSFGPNHLGMLIGGASAIVGHIFPVFLKFKGGKGISTTLGVCMVINPIVTIISIGVGIPFIFITHLGAITSFIITAPALAFAAYAYATLGASPNNIIAPLLILLIFLLTLYKHRGNIKKLFLGTENKTVLIKKKKTEK